MEFRLESLSSSQNSKVKLKIMKGHFVTEHTHVNTYIDISTLTNCYRDAREAAKLLITNYQLTTQIDTIICLDGTRLIGGFMAEMLGHDGLGNINKGQNIAVITPSFASSRQMIFRDNTKNMVEGKHVLVLAGSITTGENVLQAASAVLYYKGTVPGICAIFSNVSKVSGMNVHSIFTGRDLPDYKSYRVADCPMCQQRKKIDALVDSYGYSLL